MPSAEGSNLRRNSGYNGKQIAFFYCYFSADQYWTFKVFCLGQQAVRLRRCYKQAKKQVNPGSSLFDSLQYSVLTVEVCVPHSIWPVNTSALWRPTSASETVMELYSFLFSKAGIYILGFSLWNTAFVYYDLTSWGLVTAFFVYMQRQLRLY